MRSLYNVSQKSPAFKLSVTLSKLNRFRKIFTLMKRVRNLLQKPYDITHLTLGMLLHRWELFLRHSVVMSSIQQITRSTGTVQTSAKARLTSDAIWQISMN